MHFERTFIENNPNFTLEKLWGSISDENQTDATFSKKSLPFEAYLCKLSRMQMGVALFCTNKPQKASQIAQEKQCEVLINGGFWDTDKMPLDWCIKDGREFASLTNEIRPCIFFHNLSATIGSSKSDFPYESLLQSGPLLIGDGTVNYDYSDYQAKAGEFDSDITIDRHPRTIFGLDDEFFYCLVINGRSRRSAGLYLEECADLALDLGIINAINLDGGASSSLIVKNCLVNEPRFSFIRCSRYLSAKVPGKERKIPNALYFFEKKIDSELNNK